MKPLWRNHQLHHYKQQERGFGVSSTLGAPGSKNAAWGSWEVFTRYAFFIRCIGIGAPFKYPVFVFTGAAWVLSTIPFYCWSLDRP
ncbi:MAG TPA: hypothetical protein VHC48_14335 [Puia sp.]|nr:hypothetical protein [Puia sp.]